VFEQWMFARFVAYLPEVDLSTRASDLFDRAYAYRRCAAPGSTSMVNIEALTGYYDCTDLEEGESLSDDDFFIDLNLMLGIPAVIPESNPHWGAAGGWQAHEIPAFTGLSDPNCTGSYGDQNIAPFLWVWGFWSGQIPLVSHGEAGYNPLGHGNPSKFLVEFGVARAGGTLPVFAFSFLPKMIPLLAPSGLGASFPTFVMGKNMDVRVDLGEWYGVQTPSSMNTLGLLFGPGAMFAVTYFPHGTYTMHIWYGGYAVVWSVVTFFYAGFRLKKDAAM